METFYIFFALQILVWMCYMLPVPILPVEALERAISLEVIGVILAVYTVTCILASLVLGKMMFLWGKKKFLNLSLITLFLTTFLFGVTMLVYEKNIFIVVTILLRLIQGFACGGYSVIIYSMIPEYFPERIEEIYSYMELFGGISCGSAPLIGMFLFEIVGASMTFMIFSFTYLLLWRILNRNMNFSKTDLHEDSKEAGLNRDERFSQLSTWELLKNREYFVTFWTYCINAIGFFVVTPVLGERVTEITGDSYLIGVSYSVYWLGYALAGITLAQIFKKVKLNKKILFVVSSISQIVSYSLMGLTDSIECLILAFCLLGIGGGLCLIAFIPEAIDIGTKVYAGEYGWVGDMASLFWNIGFAFGEFVGPIWGGCLTQAYGFSVCVNLYAFLVAATLAAYLIFGSVLSEYNKTEEKLLSKEIYGKKNEFTPTK